MRATPGQTLFLALVILFTIPLLAPGQSDEAPGPSGGEAVVDKLAAAGQEFDAEMAALNGRLQESGQRLDAAATRLDGATRGIDELEAAIRSASVAADARQAGVYGLRAQLSALEARSERQRTAVEPLLSFKPYGYIKTDVIYNDAHTSSTDAATFVLPEASGFGSDRHFGITVRQTRLGLEIAGPDFAGGKQSGKVEVDFYGVAPAENRAQPMLRQAYWQLAYPDWSVTVGQTGEVMSPQFPMSVNYAYLANSGNPGYRKPGLYYHRSDNARFSTTVITDLAIVRGIGSTVLGAAALDDEGSDAGWPVVESRVGLSRPTRFGRSVAAGVSGHYGQEEYDPQTSGVATSGRGEAFSTYSGNIDWCVPVAARWDVKGELFAGRNLDAYMAGIGQGVNLDDGRAIDSVGGWSQVTYRLTPRWCLGLGAGIDDPDNSDLSAATPASPNRSRNATYFGDAVYNINDRTAVGLELSWQKTDYIQAPDGDNFRVQTSLQFGF